MGKSYFLREILLERNNVCRATNGGYADQMKVLSLLYTTKTNKDSILMKHSCQTTLRSVSRFTG